LAEPSSLVGSWLLAVLIDRSDRNVVSFDQLDDAVMQAELILVRHVFESLVRRKFQDDTDPAAIHGYAAESLRNAEKSWPGLLEMTAVIRAALSERPGPRYRGFEPEDVARIWCTLGKTIVADLGLSTPEVRQLIASGERAAAEWPIALTPVQPA
jgi:hypothetical protein